MDVKASRSGCAFCAFCIFLFFWNRSFVFTPKVNKTQTNKQKLRKIYISDQTCWRSVYFNVCGSVVVTMTSEPPAAQSLAGGFEAMQLPVLKTTWW